MPTAQASYKSGEGFAERTSKGIDRDSTLWTRTTMPACLPSPLAFYKIPVHLHRFVANLEA